MNLKEIDAHIMKCPYFDGKNTIDRRIINGETVHVGNCSLEFHYRKVCPSSECKCAEYMGLKQRQNCDGGVVMTDPCKDCSIPFGASEFLEECLSCERKLLYLKEQDTLIEDEIQEDKPDEMVEEWDA